MEGPDLVNPQNTIEILKKYDFAPHKRYGQNFLIDPHVAGKIIRAADITKDDMVLEVGPGIGALTQYLARAAGRVAAVEIDRDLVSILKDTLSGYDNVILLNEDIMKTDIAALARKENSGRPIKVAANLPYYITTPVIMKFLEGDAPLKSVTVMVQKEVADRMRAVPGTKDYGALSLAVQYRAKIRVAANVPQNCFIPRPKVGSAIVCMDIYDCPPVFAADEKLMFKVIRAAFAQRRKTLANALKNSPELTFTKEEIGAAVEKLGKGMRIRGETLTLREFAKLTDFIAESRVSPFLIDKSGNTM